jgi:hypothetical protein
MGAAVFVLGLLAFFLGFFHPGFYPVAWISLVGGAGIAVLLWAKHRRATHPTVSHLEPDADERKPIEPQ